MKFFLEPMPKENLTSTYAVIGGRLQADRRNRNRFMTTLFVDRIARANGFAYAEMFTERYEGKAVTIDRRSLKVKRVGMSKEKRTA
jgi:hypothetical protein